MAQTRKTKQRNPLRAVVLGVLVLAIIIGLAVFLGKGGKESAEASAIREGLDFLTQQEQKNPEVVRQTRKALFDRRMQAQKEEMIATLTNGEEDPFSLFRDFALLGDSRGVGFWFWDFLPEDRVLADGGHTIRMIPEHQEKLLQMQPAYIFLCYGLNDSSIGYWESGEEYAAEYVQTVQNLQELLPECTIVVSSTLPAQDPAFDVSSSWYNIPDWNISLKEACEEAGILFADCSWIYEQYSDLWDTDGIHFKQALYPYWGAELIITALYGGALNEA